MKDTKIKACPFCGQQGFLTETTSDKTIDHRHTVICAPGCGGSGMVGASPEEAVAAWNQRAGVREPATSETPSASTLASAMCYASPVAAFSKIMQRELVANERKGPWKDWKPKSSEVFSEIDHHLAKLKFAVGNWDKKHATEYAADVANYCMKIHELFGET